MGQADLDSVTDRPRATFTGSLVHTGTLKPNSSEIISCNILVSGAGIMELLGWTLDVETGDVEGVKEEGWKPRQSWSRTGSGGSIQVLLAGNEKEGMNSG